jgi:hypothetical protein
MKISERDKQAAFALLVLLAAAVAAYALFFAEPAEKQSDLEGFVASAAASPKIGLFMDGREASAQEVISIGQCGTDLASGRLFGSHVVETYGCDNAGCISTSSEGNGSAKLTYEQARRKLREMPYVAISAGKPSTLFFERHIEIRLDASYNASCRLG